MLPQNKDTFTSLELVELINRFRTEEGNKKELRQDNLMAVIRDEFEEEIRSLNIQESSQSVPMPNGGTRQQPMYILNLHQSRQVLVRESKFVRRAVIVYIDRLEQQEQLQAPKTMKEALLLALEQQERLEEQQRQLELQAPKVIFADAVSASKSSILVGELAKVMKQNGIEIGQNRLFDWLRANGYLHKKGRSDFNMPTQRSMELELFEIKKSVVTNPDGSIRETRTPKVTGKGQLYFINKFLNK